MKKNMTLFIFIFCFIILNIFLSVNFINKRNLNDNIIRLHIVANSNKTQDQIVKLKIYEKINEYINSIRTNKDMSNEELLNLIKSNANKIIEISNSTLRQNNFSYDTKLEIGKIYYDEKQSINLDMQAGSYNSIKVMLGDSEGNNIWSIIFPNKENIDKLQPLNSIFPEISNIYGTSNYAKKKYKIKLMKLLKKGNEQLF